MNHHRPESIVRSGALGAAAVLVAGLLSGCGEATPSAREGGRSTGGGISLPTPDPASIVWLCRPGLADNPCEMDLTATVVKADGSTDLEPGPPAAASQPAAAASQS
ncbi:MAG TPA: hypothetical protein VF349_08325, partial [Candidatus Limnocylindrales bacterium]